MSIVRVGATKQYSDNWSNIFGGGKRLSSPKPKSTSTKSAKSKSAKKSPAKKKAAAKAGRNARGAR